MNNTASIDLYSNTIDPGLIEATPNQASTLEDLYAQLDLIYGTPKELSESEQKELNSIFEEMDSFWMDVINDAQGIDDLTSELTDPQLLKLADMEERLNEVLGIKSYDDLTEDEQARVDEINGEIDSYFSDVTGEDFPFPIDGDNIPDDGSWGCTFGNMDDPSTVQNPSHNKVLELVTGSQEVGNIENVIGYANSEFTLPEMQIDLSSAMFDNFGIA